MTFLFLFLNGCPPRAHARVTAVVLSSCQGHSSEIICVSFNQSGELLLTGSFDNTVGVWQCGSMTRLHSLIGHRSEISSCLFNHEGSLILSGSMDKTCKVWDAATGECLKTLRDHTDEVLDVVFSISGLLICTVSADGKAHVYDTIDWSIVSSLTGHDGEISKVSFNPHGTTKLTLFWDLFLPLFKPDTPDTRSCDVLYIYYSCLSDADWYLRSDAA